MVNIEIFDPPLCCPTGVCGPTIDPALLDVQEAILRVQSEFDGRVRVERYALGQQPGKFMLQPEVATRLKAQGVTVLPITLVDGRAVKEKAYPAYTELLSWIEDAVAPATQETREAS
jgi:hypothetical protein